MGRGEAGANRGRKWSGRESEGKGNSGGGRVRKRKRHGRVIRRDGWKRLRGSGRLGESQRKEAEWGRVRGREETQWGDSEEGLNEEPEGMD